MALAVLVCAGSLKSHPLLAWMPVDLTLLAAVVVLVMGVSAILHRNFIPLAFWVPLAFVVTTVLGLVEYASAYGNEKALHFYTLTLLGMLAAALVLRDERQRSAFLTTLAVIAVIVTVLVTIAPERPAAWSTVVTLPGTNTIATSRLILAGVIVVVLRAMIGDRKPIARILLIMLAGFMILTALNTGARGPIIAAAVGVIVALLVTPAFGRRRLRSIILTLGVVGAGGYFASQTQNGGLDRIMTFIEGGTDTSAGARTTFWDVALQHIPQVPFGGGWGYFGRIVKYGGDKDATTVYPHNSVIEITLEAGWAAGAAFVFLAIVAFIRYVRASDAAQPAAFFVLFVFAFANSLVSGDVNDNRLMWVLLIFPFLLHKPETTDSPRLPAGDEKQSVGILLTQGTR
ncbi:O-antigen ligase family protein [Microbacterium sp. LWH12-1.2]|uniref:O-antigen ligase family protein n=1 Tax=Microbacterium sp. LWH12-1.2 TaxID=3135259 RepID=UPI00341C36CB